jgi:hypothetical protein
LSSGEDLRASRSPVGGWNFCINVKVASWAWSAIGEPRI